MLGVLVPFDIGVVYILYVKVMTNLNCFSPLRYWGGLYLKEELYQLRLEVLVPFDIGVVYIKICESKKINFVLVPFDIGVVYITQVW